MEPSEKNTLYNDKQTFHRAFLLTYQNKPAKMRAYSNTEKMSEEKLDTFLSPD